MSTLKNSVRLVGHLGNEPEIKMFGDNKSLARVSIATKDVFKNSKGEWLTDTQWHNLIFWGKLASYAGEKLKKGMEINVEGKLVNRSYTGADGIIRYVSEVVVNRVNVGEKNKDK